MIPKGAIEPGETPSEAALREFAEETGTTLHLQPVPLATIRQSGGKVVEAFAMEGDLEARAIQSIEFEAEWPPRSGRMQRYPEAEEARWMNFTEARSRMLPSQLPLLDALQEMLAR